MLSSQPVFQLILVFVFQMSDPDQQQESINQMNVIHNVFFYLDITKLVHNLFLGLIVTGSWDKFVKLWDPRTNQCTGKYEQPEKVL